MSQGRLHGSRASASEPCRCVSLGKVHPPDLRSIHPALTQTLRRQGHPLPDIYVCGSPGMVEAVRAAATEAGLPEDRVFHEQCGAASP